MKNKILILFIWLLCNDITAQNYFSLSAEIIILDLRFRASLGEVITVKDLKTQEIQSDSLLENEYVSGMVITIGQSTTQEIYFDEELVCDSMVILFYDPNYAELELDMLVADVKENWVKLNDQRYVSTNWTRKSVTNPSVYLGYGKITTFTVPQLNINRQEEGAQTVFIYSELNIDEQTWKELKKGIVNQEVFREHNFAGTWEVCVEFTFDPGFTCDSGWAEYSFIGPDSFGDSKDSTAFEWNYELTGSLLFLKSPDRYPQRQVYQIQWINDNSFYSVGREGKRGPKIYTYFTKID